MGATKRLGEIYCQALDRRGGRARHSGAPRQCAGLGRLGGADLRSAARRGRPAHGHRRGSDALFPLHPASGGCAAAGGGDRRWPADSARGAALVIEMGEALPVVELAREVIRLEGLRPDEDVPIVFTGLRPGEKLHEALVASRRVARERSGARRDRGDLRAARPWRTARDHRAPRRCWRAKAPMRRCAKRCSRRSRRSRRKAKSCAAAG